MANVLVINFPGEGHINPTLAIVSELIQRGKQLFLIVLKIIERRLKQQVRNSECLRIFSQINIMERVNEGGSPLTMLSHMIEASERIVTQIVEETKEEKYDYLIYDNHFPVGRIIANILQLPSVSSCTTFAVNQYINFHDEQESRQVDEMNPLYQSCLAGMERWNKQYGMKCNSMYDIMNHPGDITIVYTSKEYQPRSEVFDESYKFVFNCYSKRSGEFSYQRFKNEKVIFISMGTVFNEQPALYEKCFEAFKDVDATVVLVVGKKINISQFENIPKILSCIIMSRN